MYRVLILGGYGVFGGRLIDLLSEREDLTLLVAGRNLRAADAFVAERFSRATLVAVAGDRSVPDALLDTLKPDLVVDASGPFQTYGADPYALARAAILRGIHYLDFADGADFVAGFATLDPLARERGVVALSGVSSFPVLTFAVLQEMKKRMNVTRATGGIAPSPYAGVGKNVMRAVIGYAGAPVHLWRNGREATGIGLAETRRFTIGPPGIVPLNNIRFSLVDVPDLRLIPAAMPEIRDIWMGAGPVPEILHRILNLLARMRHALHLPSLAPLAGLFYRVLNLMKFGEHRGGMFVAAEGDGKRLSWHLIAEGDDGPLIPSMAIEHLVRQMADGHCPEPGARAALGALTLDNYAERFADRAIRFGWRDDSEGPLYERILDGAFSTLPPVLQSLHRPGSKSVWSGRANVTGASGLARLVRKVFRFPHPAQELSVNVTFATDAAGRETWSRNFDGRVMRSTQEVGLGRNAYLMVERFGPFAFALALVVDGDRLKLITRRWSLLGIPLPRFLMPKGDSYESTDGGKFQFHVEIDVPLIGNVVTYDGWLLPVTN